MKIKTEYGIKYPNGYILRYVDPDPDLIAELVESVAVEPELSLLERHVMTATTTWEPVEMDAEELADALDWIGDEQ